MALLCVRGYCSDEKQKRGVREYGTGVCVRVYCSDEKQKRGVREQDTGVCVCVVTAVTKNRTVECEKMTLLYVCMLGYCSDEKQKRGVREYGTGVCVCVCVRARVVTTVTKNRNVECENMALFCVCAWLLH